MARLCEGRVAIVTGGGRGIGREYALELARHGAQVVVNDLGTGRDGRGADNSAAEAVVAEIKAAGGAAIANGEDISDWEGARRLIAHAVSAFGRLDVLVNNAGILRDRMLVNMEESDWDAVIKVHLKGTFAPSHTPPSIGAPSRKRPARALTHASSTRRRRPACSAISARPITAPPKPASPPSPSSRRVS